MAMLAFPIVGAVAGYFAGPAVFGVTALLGAQVGWSPGALIAIESPAADPTHADPPV